MGKSVNVILPGGRVVEVDEAEAARSGLARESEEAGVARATAMAQKEAHSGPLETVAAGALGAMDTVSGGLAGKAIGYFGGEDVGDWYQENAQEHPLARLSGELGGMFIPTGLNSLAGGANKALGGKALGRVAEGGIYGLGGSVASTNVTGDPLSIEGVIEEVGVGGLLNYGFGLAGDKLTGIGKRAQAKLAAGDQLKKDLTFIAEGEGIFAKENGAYDEFRTAYDDARKAAHQSNAAATREEKAWNNAVSDSGVAKGIDVVKSAQQELREQIAQTAYGKTIGKTERAHNGALKQYEADKKAFNALVDSTEDLPKALKKFDKEIKKLEDRPGWTDGDDLLGDLTATKAHLDSARPFADEVQAAARKAEKFGDRKAWIKSVYDNMPEASRGTFDEFKSKLLKEFQTGEGIDLTRADLSGAFKDNPLHGASELKADGADFHFIGVDDRPLADVKLPTKAGEESTAAQLKRYREQLSVASKKLTGGVEPEAGRWVRDKNIPRDVEGGMADLHALRDEMRRKYSRAELPDLPAIPKHPGEFKAPHGDINDVVEVAQMSQMSRDLDATVQRARQMASKGDYKGAVAELQAAAVRAKEGGFGDLVFPKFPPPARERVPVPPNKAPTSLREFAAKNSASELAQVVQGMPKEVGEAWGKVMDDLTLKRVGSHADNIEATWKQLNAYERAGAELKAKGRMAAAKAGDPGFLGDIGDAAKRGARVGFGRLFDTGGVGGSIRRSVAGAVLGYAIDGVEGATIGAGILGGRQGVKDRITQIAAKAGPRAGSMMRALGPVTSYLHASFPSGKKDSEGDPRKAAVNRIRDIQLAAHAAPDAAYMLVEPLMGQPSDVAWKVHQQLVGAVQYLAAMAPKDPGMDMRLQGSNWAPTHAQSLEFAARIEAVVDPLAAIARSIAGDAHPATAETLWHVWPAIMQEHAQEFLAMDRSKLTYEQESVAARLLGVETGLREPAIVATLQGMYLPAPTQPQSGGGTGGKPGRPAAVQSPVAGSSVSALIS